MADSKELRTGFIGVSEIDKTTTYNRRVDIMIIATTPIMAGEYIDRMTKVGVAPIDGVIEVKEMITPTPDVNYNVLVDLSVDKDGNFNKLDRYKFLGKALSTQYSGLFLDFYYDKDFKDIIAIPELKTFGYDDNVKFYENDKRTIKGTTIGLGCAMGDQPWTTTSLPVFKDDMDGLEEPKRFTKTKTYTTTVYGLEQNSICNSISRDQAGTTNYSEKGSPLQFIEFNSNLELYDQDNVSMHCFNLLQQYQAEMKIDYVGKRKIHKIVVPINF